VVEKGTTDDGYSAFHVPQKQAYIFQQVMIKNGQEGLGVKV
jgi:hypothetical protein